MLSSDWLLNDANLTCWLRFPLLLLHPSALSGSLFVPAVSACKELVFLGSPLPPVVSGGTAVITVKAKTTLLFHFLSGEAGGRGEGHR